MHFDMYNLLALRTLMKEKHITSSENDGNSTIFRNCKIYILRILENYQPKTYSILQLLKRLGDHPFPPMTNPSSLAFINRSRVSALISWRMCQTKRNQDRQKDLVGWLVRLGFLWHSSCGIHDHSSFIDDVIHEWTIIIIIWKYIYCVCICYVIICKPSIHPKTFRHAF